MKILLTKLSGCLLCLVLTMACTRPAANPGDNNAMYYWRTTFTLNDAERDFLEQHNIKRLYVRFFDVDDEFKPVHGEKVIPKATIQFIDSIPAGVEVVPTIYITNHAMQEMQLQEYEHAEKILRRVDAICRRNGIEFKELQLDCDWTKHTRPYFFRLCQEIKQRLAPGQSLSSTIRLHQLVQTPPPVDRGVLMVYNTGNLMEITTENSIFSPHDIEPYLRDRRLADYALPLDVAYPTYGWSVVFNCYGEKPQFDRIMRRTDFSNYPGIKKTGKNQYEVTADIQFDPDIFFDWVYPGQIIRVERPTAKEIMTVKRMIDSQLTGKPHCNILYHLDESQFLHYSSNEIDKIYAAD